MPALILEVGVDVLLALVDEACAQVDGSVAFAVRLAAEDDEGLLELEYEARGIMRNIRGLRPRDEDSFAMNRPEMIQEAIGGFFSADRLARTAPQSAGFLAACGAAARWCSLTTSSASRRWTSSSSASPKSPVSLIVVSVRKARPSLWYCLTVACL